MLRIYDRAVHIRENAELIRHPDVIAVRRNAVTDDALSHLPVGKRLDHPVLQRHPANPPVWLYGHPFPPHEEIKMV
jgi:hypothetical protein